MCEHKDCHVPKCFNCGNHAKQSADVGHTRYDVCNDKKCKDFLATLFRESLDK